MAHTHTHTHTTRAQALYLHGTVQDKVHLRRTGKEVFAIAVKIFAKHNAVIVTRVGVMVVWPDRAPAAPVAAPAGGSGGGSASQAPAQTKDNGDTGASAATPTCGMSWPQ